MTTIRVMTVVLKPVSKSVARNEVEPVLFQDSIRWAV